jgi:dolichyl-phosphate-mannose--protein O-mannosyl transferase
VEWLFAGVIFLLAAAFRFWRIDHPAGVVCVAALALSLSQRSLNFSYALTASMRCISASLLPTTSAASSSSTSIHHCELSFASLSQLLQLQLTRLLLHRAKLLLAFAGWVIGYDGHYEFENIGESYVDNKVPYVGLRVLPAVLGSLVPPVVYGIMRESGYPRIVGVLSAALVLIGEFVGGRASDSAKANSRFVADNAHVTQTRLILLDAPLVLFMSIAFYSYIRFHKLRYSFVALPRPSETPS